MGGNRGRWYRRGPRYKAGDIVKYEGTTYDYWRCKADTNSTEGTPETNTDDWEDMGSDFGSGDENPFDGPGYYPSACAFFEDRLWLGGFKKEPQTIAGSMIGNQQMFLLGAYDADAINFMLNANTTNQINWMLSAKDLIIGTTGGEWVVTGGRSGISASNVSATKQTAFGSNYVQGIQIADTVVFVQKDGKRLREYYYWNENQAYQSQDLTAWASHILSGKGKYIEYSQDPEPLLYVVTEDGEIRTLTYEKTTNAKGWARLITDGHIESIAVVPAFTEDDVWVTVIRDINGTSKRFMEYFSTRNFEEKEDAYFVDCGITQDLGEALDIEDISNESPANIEITGHPYSTNDYVRLSGVEGMEADILDFSLATSYVAGDIVTYNDAYYKCHTGSTGNLPTDTDYFFLYVGDLTTEGKVYKITKVDPDNFTLNGTDFRGFTAYTSGGECEEVFETVSGLGHLNGELCAVFADGAKHADATPSAGAITLTRYANKVHVGLKYSSILQTLRIETGGAYGTSQAKMKRIHQAAILFYRTLGCEVGRDEDNVEELTFREASDPLGESPELFTGHKVFTFAGTHDRDGYIYIKTDDPVPLSILAIMPEVVVYE
jgi:hypothetical protein